MAEVLSFSALIDRVRAGEAEAAEELVRRYEPAIRRTVRVRLSDSRLRRVLDSIDICQSVLGSFFVRAALGQYDLESHEQLIKLLVTMAHNKLSDQFRRELAERRDERRVEATRSDEREIATSEATPSQVIEAEDLLAAVRRRLTDKDRYLAEQRAGGRPWSELAAELHSSPEALRKQLVRAIRQALEELGVESVQI
jgi:RNA polymerase sigma-70 factor (ECF subfamily)